MPIACAWRRAVETTVAIAATVAATTPVRVVIVIISHRAERQAAGETDQDAAEGDAVEAEFEEVKDDKEQKQ